jgi:hypothetical protein
LHVVRCAALAIVDRKAGANDSEHQLPARYGQNGCVMAVGRNSWTFLGSDRGGKTFAILKSFVASCELLKIDPFKWLRDVLTRIPTHSIQQLDQLLPHAWAAART